MNILIFLLVLFLLVLVHEWGHFIVAKKTGMRVDEFGIGFPPKLFGITWRGTQYTFNLFPIGGFVKIFGENSEEVGNVASASDSFTAKSKWAQAAVLIAGVTMNVVFAWMLYVAAFSIGTLGVVEEAVAGEDAMLIVTEVLPGSPAAEAGITQGARITALETGDETLSALTPSSFREFTTLHSDDVLTVSYNLGDETITAELEPQSGLVEDEPNRAAIGVAIALFETTSMPVTEALYESAKVTYENLGAITVGLGGLLWDAVRLQADFSQVAGPVGIVGLVGQASAFGFVSLLMFTAFISLNLAVINLFPFPALDGGRLVMVAVEAIKGSPIRPSFVYALNAVGFMLLIFLMVAVTFNDILRII